MPDSCGCDYLVEILFRIGPVIAEGPVKEADIEGWEKRRGVQLTPWQADTIIDMSRAYLGEMHTARQMSAPAPWPKAIKMWKYVTENINAPQEKPRNGNRQ